MSGEKENAWDDEPKGEGSLLKIYGKKDAKGNKKAVSEIWYAQYRHHGKTVRVSTGETSKMKK